MSRSYNCQRGNIESGYRKLINLNFKYETLGNFPQNKYNNLELSIPLKIIKLRHACGFPSNVK